MFSVIRASLFRTSRKLEREWRRIVNRKSICIGKDAILRLLQTEETPRRWSRKSDWHNSNRSLSSSTIHTRSNPQSASHNLVSSDESLAFMAIFPDIVRDLMDVAEEIDMPEVAKRCVELFHYNVPNGKKSRGLTVVASYKMLERPENLTSENIRLANIMGWCVELLQATFIMIDDIMDNSQTRRGHPCWYRKEGVGLHAIGDALTLEQSAYTILKKHFSNHHAYSSCVEVFHNVTMSLSMGQAMDMMFAQGGKPHLELFTMNRYNIIIKQKTANYSFRLPVALAMYMAGIYDFEMHRQARTITVEMGMFFQIQDDFLDCFGDASTMGKKGNDIQEGKCTWLAVVALQRTNAAQRKIMEAHYGKPNEESVGIIRNLYEELGLPSTYAIYEEESFNIIRTHIQQISKGMPQEIFLRLMEKLYMRKC